MRRTLCRWVAAAGLIGASVAQAQTAWPSYMPTLPAAWSESPVAAVLPPDVSVVRPDPALAPERARWGGVWQGWACRAMQCDVRLAVEKLSAAGATVVYAGASATQTVVERAEGQFVGPELVVRLSTGARLVLRMRPDADLEMSLWKPDTQLVAAGVLTQKTLDYVRRVERVPTPWTENGAPQTLEMVVYRPLGTDPLPTLVFNYGSTGNGDRPEWFTHTWTSPELARHFTAQGWQVVFPQRRGRGRSDGLYDEGFLVDRTRYACEPERSLPGLERALTDLDAVMAHVLKRSDVEAQRLLIGGVSRGGILSVAYAGRHPETFHGVINFVGGWVGDRCSHANEINSTSFRRGAVFARPMLWLYGDKDPFYSLRHSRRNFDAFVAAGGQGRFVTFEPPPDQNGHAIHTRPALWSAVVDDYLRQVLPR